MTMKFAALMRKNMISIVMKTHIRHDLTYLTAKKAMKASAGLLRKIVDLKDISMTLDFL